MEVVAPGRTKLMTAFRRIVSSNSKCGRLAWRIKGSLSTWRPISRSMVLAMMSSRNLASTPVLSAVVVLATINSIHCSQCMLWVHKICSGITKWLVADPNHVCCRCNGEAWLIDDRTVTEVYIDGTMLDMEATFCYLGDMLCSGGGCDSVIAARCCVAWGKFRKLLPVLTTRHLSRRIWGKVYKACVHWAMLHCSKHDD